MRVQILFSDQIAEYEVKVDTIVSDKEQLKKILEKAENIGQEMLGKDD